jgi:hypothetical protein
MTKTNAGLCLPVWILTGLMSVSGAGESAAVQGQIFFAAHRKFEHFKHFNSAKYGRFPGQFVIYTAVFRSGNYFYPGSRFFPIPDSTTTKKEGKN